MESNALYSVHAYGPYDYTIFGPFQSLEESNLVANAVKTETVESFPMLIESLGQNDPNGRWVVHSYGERLGTFGPFGTREKAEEAAQSAGFRSDLYTVDRINEFVKH